MQKFYSTQLLKKIKAHIQRGGIIAYPTESCYGFGCDPFNRLAVNKILKLKGRSRAKGLIVIAACKQQIEPLLGIRYNFTDFAKYWPGHYTLLLKPQPNIPKTLIGRHSKIAIRMSSHQLVHQICSTLNSAIVSTSANQTGQKPITSYRECYTKFGTEVLVLPGLTNFAPKPSTIIDWDTKRILR